MFSPLDQEKELQRFLHDPETDEPPNWGNRMFLAAVLLTSGLVTCLAVWLYQQRPPDQTLVIKPYSSPIKRVPLDSTEQPDLAVLSLHNPQTGESLTRQPDVLATEQFAEPPQIPATSNQVQQSPSTGLGLDVEQGNIVLDPPAENDAQANEARRQRLRDKILQNLGSFGDIAEQDQQQTKVERSSEVVHQTQASDSLQQVLPAKGDDASGMISHVQIVSAQNRKDAVLVGALLMQRYATGMQDKHMQITQEADEGLFYLTVQGFANRSEAVYWCEGWRALNGECLVIQKATSGSAG